MDNLSLSDEDNDAEDGDYLDEDDDDDDFFD